jgi:hypothetical protein
MAAAEGTPPRISKGSAGAGPRTTKLCALRATRGDGRSGGFPVLRNWLDELRMVADVKRHENGPPPPPARCLTIGAANSSIGQATLQNGLV